MYAFSLGSGLKRLALKIVDRMFFAFSSNEFPVSFSLTFSAETGFRIHSPEEVPVLTSSLICRMFSNNKMAMIAASNVANVETTTMTQRTG